MPLPHEQWSGDIQWRIGGSRGTTVRPPSPAWEVPEPWHWELRKWWGRCPRLVGGIAGKAEEKANRFGSALAWRSELSRRNRPVSWLHLSGRQRACRRQAYGEIGEITACAASICPQYLLHLFADAVEFVLLAVCQTHICLFILGPILCRICFILLCYVSPHLLHWVQEELKHAVLDSALCDVTNDTHASLISYPRRWQHPQLCVCSSPWD